MFRTRDPNDWMWAHALSLLDEAERMHRRFFSLAPVSQSQATWEPPVDVFENEREIVLVVALPGVVAERVSVKSEEGVLVVRAERPFAPAAARYAVRQLEIPYGVFERRIRMPEGARVDGAPQLDHGCLVLRLTRKANPA